MNRNQKLATLAVAAALGIASAASAHAAEPRSTQCAISIQMQQGSVAAPVTRFTKDFDITVVDGTTYFEDFSTAFFTRIRDITVKAVPGAGKAAAIDISMYADVGVFDWIEFKTVVNVERDDAPVVSTGRSSWGSSSTGGDHFTVWSISCQRLKA